MIDIFICEDNLIQRAKLETIINNYLLMSDLNMKLTLSTDNPDDLLTYLELHPQTKGVYFLDVDLNHQLDGIQLGAKIRDLCVDGKIIYITTHGELAPLTFKYKVEAMDYIAKDHPAEMQRRIIEALEQAHKHYVSERKVLDDRIRLEVGHQVRLFEMQEIMFIETSTFSHKLILHLSNSLIEFYGKITEIEQLSPEFIRVHKSFVANRQNIIHIDRQKRTLTFRNGETCWASIRQIANLNRAFRAK